MDKRELSGELASSIDLLSAWIESQMAYKGLPGLSIGIIYDQELVWSKGFGFADVEKKIPASPKTLYRIASISKLFTSTALLHLRDAGKLQMDDPIQKHLPWFSIQNKHADSPPILLRHLITHTSGLPRESAFPYWDTAVFPSYEEVKKALPEQELTLRPETRWKYSNLALSLAGCVVAAVSGMSYEDYVEQHILKPLGMLDTHVRTIPQDHPDFAVGYGRRMPGNSRSIRPFGDCKGITPAANLTTSVQDLAKFAMLQFRDGPAGGKQILSGHTLREMHTVHWLDEDWQIGWGWGFMVLRVRGKTFIGHGGSLMGFRTNLMLCPKDKVAVVVLTNADDGDPAFYADKAMEWVTPGLLKMYAPKPVKKEIDPLWKKYVGKYRSAWGDTQILIRNDELVAIDPSVADPTADIIKLLPVAEHTFQVEMKNGFGDVGELAVFELDNLGKVIRLRIGENPTNPVDMW